MAESGIRVGLGHLFATGSDTARDAIVHIAGARFAATADPAERNWVLNPGRRISQRIYGLTGIGTREASAKPHWSAARKDIGRFFEELDVLFVCDIRRQRDWFADVVLREVGSPPVVVDVLEMSQFFRPEAGVPYTEKALMEMAPARRARAAARPLLRVMEGLRSLLTSVLHAILEGSEETSGNAYYPVYGLLSQALAAGDAPEDFRAMHAVAGAAHALRWEEGTAGLLFDRPREMAEDSLMAFVGSWLPDETGAGRKRKEASGEARPVKWRGVEEVLASLSAVIPDFEKRQEQVRFASFCTDAINNHGSYVAEAGTGTGKTLGYFIPACEHARLNPASQVVIATSTKNLMRQILDKEWHTLQRMPQALYRDLEVAQLKGKQNYLCLSALRQLFLAGRAEYRRGDAAVRLSWLYLFLVLMRDEGRWEGAPAGFEQKFTRLREFALSANAQEACVRGLCSLGLSCVYPRALERARKANIVITNHHKLATLDDAISERKSVCIVDEADLFPDNLRGAVTIEINRFRLWRFLRQALGTRQRRGFVRILEERLEGERGRDPDRQGVLEALKRIQRTCYEIGSLLDAIGSIGPARGFGMRWDDMAGDEREQLDAALSQLKHGLETLEYLWTRIADSKRYAKGDGQELKWQQRERRSVQQNLNMVRELSADVAELATGFPCEDHTYVFHRLQRRWSIQKVPFDFAESAQPGSDFVAGLKKRDKGTVIFTSATLYVDGKLDLFCRELFNDDRGSRHFRGVARFDSPFNYPRQVGGAVAAFLPSFSYSAGGTRARPRAVSWKDEVARTIALLTVAAAGRSLVLFTNTQEMRDIYERVLPVLEGHDIELLLQSGASRSATETFAAVEQSVLMGVNRFWTGVDFPGPTLSQVIVVRLPNPSLGDPLVKHRRQYWDQGTFWNSWYGPTTRLMLRQGFGRLIRRQSDAGVFVLLDPRIVTNRNMQRHAEVLPVGLRPISGSALELADWVVGRLRLQRELQTRDLDLAQLHGQLARLVPV